jgi:hypothetical protein
MQNLQKYLRGIQMVEGNSKFSVWNETAVQGGIQNALCRICKKFHQNSTSRGELKIPHME